MPKYYLLFSLLFLLGCQKSKESVEVSEPQLFSLLSPEQTQVNFQNNIQEGLNTNVLMYEYFYNVNYYIKIRSPRNNGHWIELITNMGIIMTM